MSVFDKKGASKFLGVSEVSIDRYRKNGKLSFRKIGDRVIFTESDLTTFLENCAVPATVVLTGREKLDGNGKGR